MLLQTDDLVVEAPVQARVDGKRGRFSVKRIMLHFRQCVRRFGSRLRVRRLRAFRPILRIVRAGIGDFRHGRFALRKHKA